MQVTFHRKGISCRARTRALGLAEPISDRFGGSTEASAGSQLMRLLHAHAQRTRGRGRLIEELRGAIDCLRVRTLEAMLAGVRDGQPIIVGSYVDAEGGVCPMLAAHRRGGRT